MKQLFYNIAAGSPEKLIKPAAYATLSNLVNILPFALVIEAVRVIFDFYAAPSGTELDTSRLWWVCASLAASLAVMFVAEIPAYRSAYRGAYSVAAEGRVRLAEHLRKLPLGYLMRRDPGDLANLMMGDFALVEHGVSHLIPQLVGAAVLPVVALAGLAYVDWRMAVALFAAVPVAILVVLASSRLQRRLSSSHMRTKIAAANRFQEYLNGIRVMKAYNLTGINFTRLEFSFRQLMRESIRLEGLLGPVIMIALACMKAGLTFMVIVGVHLLLGGDLDLTTLVMFLVIGTRIFDPMTTALVNYAELRYDEQAGERIVQLCREPVMAGEQAPPDACHIALEHVSFSYGEQAVIRDVSLELPEGSLTALVGPSGSGKSTLLRLIARFYDPDQGAVLWGGVDARRMDPEALLQKVSMVFQDVYLFQDTIGNNIRFGRTDADQAEVEAAARRACCHDFIMKLPLGYNTPVGEGGSTLSGGEKQRISIARAILKNAQVVLLDEATASLDPENELEIQKAINELTRGRTVIVIAHRLKTVQSADRIIVLNHGAVAEQGSHEELLAAKGLYAHMWELQRKGGGWSMAAVNIEVDKPDKVPLP